MNTTQSGVREYRMEIGAEGSFCFAQFVNDTANGASYHMTMTTKTTATSRRYGSRYSEMLPCHHYHGADNSSTVGPGKWRISQLMRDIYSTKNYQELFPDLAIFNRVLEIKTN